MGKGFQNYLGNTCIITTKKGKCFIDFFNTLHLSKVGKILLMSKFQIFLLETAININFKYVNLSNFCFNIHDDIHAFLM